MQNHLLMTSRIFVVTSLIDEQAVKNRKQTSSNEKYQQTQTTMLFLLKKLKLNISRKKYHRLQTLKVGQDLKDS